MQPLLWVAAALVAANIGQYLFHSVAVSRLERERAVLSSRIDDPVNGFVRQVAQCQTNLDDQKANLARLAGEVTKLGEDSKARDDDLKRNIAVETKAVQAAQRRTNEILSRPREAQTIGTLEACNAGERALRGLP